MAERRASQRGSISKAEGITGKRGSVAGKRGSVLGRASVSGEGEEPVVPAKSSLLDVVIAEYGLEKHLRTSRLLLTAEIMDGVADPEKEIEEFHKEFMAATREKGTRVTGVVFLLSKKGVVLLLEAPTTVLFEMLRLLRADSVTNLYKNARILSLTEEVPREFRTWAKRSIPDFPDAEFVPPKTWLKEVFETLKGFLELGREMVDMDDEKALQYIAAGNSKAFLARIPSVDKIRGYAKSEDLCSVDEYLDIYDTPVECTLEGELVWPVEPPLKY